MEVVLEIPEIIAAQLQTNGRTLRQRALEDLAVEAYRRLGQFADLLDLSINDANGLLKERDIFDEFLLEEIAGRNLISRKRVLVAKALF